MPTTKTTTPELTDTQIALKDLQLHPLNARAASPETYEVRGTDTAADIPILAASIATLGLLNPLIVQKTEDNGKPVWGVLAGGRRLAALRLLTEDKAAKGWTKTTKIACRSIGEDIVAATAITVAENVTQAPMDPLDEYEAFARMIEAGGHSVDSIAKTFGVEARRVAERLRYGRVHPDIRQAAREKRITLDVMKAFASHPDHATQWAVYEATEGSYRQAWTIRDRLERAGIKLGSPLGRYVEADYRAADGAITADLIEEDSVLTDEGLVERVLEAKLQLHAEEERARLGFAWAEGWRSCDYEALRAYGRTYPSVIEPDGEAAERCRIIADRLLAIDEARDAAEEMDDGTNFDALEDEYAELTEEHEALTTGWTEEQSAKAGVIAHWRYDRVEVVYGLIRPEDMEADTDETTSGAGGAATGTGQTGDGSGSDGTTDDGPAPFEVAASLAADLRTERAIVIGAGLAADPALAQDLALFKIVSDLWNAHGTRVSWSMGITASRGERPHGKPDGMDQRSAEAIAALREGVDLTWMDGAQSVTERFERFRLLDADMKARIVGVALAEAIAPAELGDHEALLTHIAGQVVPHMRAAWRPTGEAFFGRIKKAQLLDFLAHDLKQPEEAARLATAKKVDVVDYFDRLFAAPFATLTPDQREAVEAWCPPGMEIPALRDCHRIEVTGDTSAVAEIDGEEAFDADPDEEFGADDEDHAPADVEVGSEPKAEAA